MAEGSGGSLSVNAAGNRRPPLRDLHNHVLLEVADKWEDLGVQLLLPSHQGELRVIAADHPNDVRGCCKCVLKKWLDTTPEASWNQLIRALRSPNIQLDYLASQLEQMLIKELGQSAASSGECSKICELTSIDDIEVEFAMMTEKIKQALICSNVNVVVLIEQLCAISAVSDKNVPLFDKDVFEKMKSIDEFWRELRIFWNIFDYDLLRFIVKVSRCEEAQVILDKFLSRIDPSLIEDVDLVLRCRVEHREGSLKPVLRIKVNAEQCTLSIQRKVKKTVSEKFNLREYVLCFRGIKKGCIELVYYVSKRVMSHFLQYTIDKNILKGLSSCNIISLHINDHVLKVPHEITNIKATWTVDSQQEIRKSGKPLPYHDHDPLPVRMTPSKSFDIYSGMWLPDVSLSPADHLKFMQFRTGDPIKKTKSQLNELFQKYGVTDAKYSSSDDVTGGNVHNFKATLTYTVHGRKYQYKSRGVFGRKQDAEEDAAQQALGDLERQLKKPGEVSYKQLLKERYCDKRQLPAPQYNTQSSGGGFVSTVNVPQYKPVTGSGGGSKKEAEQLAAMEALRQLKLS